MGVFLITKKSNGKFQFHLKSPDGETLLSSQDYITKSSCENGIFLVKTTLKDSNKILCNIVDNGRVYFSVKAINESVLGTSDIYVDQTKMSEAIEVLKSCAPTATIKDDTI